MERTGTKRDNTVVLWDNAFDMEKKEAKHFVIYVIDSFMLISGKK